MNVVDFLPKYPNIDNSEDDLLNPYDDNFYSDIFRKKEFYDERLPVTENFPDEKGILMKNQKIIARYLSSHTMFDELLLSMAMGSGKSCCAIGAIEQIKSELSTFKGAYIFAKGETILNNFMKELRDKCTAGQYVPIGHTVDIGNSCSGDKKGQESKQLSDLELVHRSRKLYEHYYHIKLPNGKPTTFETFTGFINKMSDDEITETFSNYIIVIDEVHNLRIKEDTTGILKMYDAFHRFLHLIRNRKILLLSGTPMKDTPDEIASIMNLILPLDRQLETGSNFISKYLVQKSENVYEVKKNKITELKGYFKGRVSFLNSMRSDVKQTFIGKKNVGKLKHLVVDIQDMSKHQTNGYIEAYTSDVNGSESGVYSNSRQASLFVFPDGTYGQPMVGTGKGKKEDTKKGFSKYVLKKPIKKKAFTIAQLSLMEDDDDEENVKGKKKKPKEIFEYSLSVELKNAILGTNYSSLSNEEKIEQKLVNLAKYSIKYSTVIRNILEGKNKSAFVYCEFVGGSGSILFAQILTLFGFSSATGLEKNLQPKLRFGLMTYKTATTKQIGRIRDCFNNPANKHGHIIKVLIGSKLVSEGISFSNVQQEFILTPWFNYSETSQAIARGIRFGSHKDLKNPVVDIYLTVARPNKKYIKISPICVELYMYELSEDKDISIRAIMRLLMESSFDCSLNYFRNHVTGFDGKRECDYDKCDYVCDGIDMKNIEDGLEIDEIDNSTYQLYYSNPKTLPIRKKLEKLFSTNNDLDLKSIINYFDGEYSEADVRNALKTLIDNGDDKLYYRDFMEIYSQSTVKKIMMHIEALFKQYFRLSLNDIGIKVREKFSDFTLFDLLTSLRTLINENIVIKNKYGFSSYIREENDVYFLVNSLSVIGNSFSNYYTKTPNIINNDLFSSVLYNIQVKLLPNVIEALCKVSKINDFTRLMKIFPDTVQEMFIEASISAREQDVKKSIDIRNMVFKYFENYIHEIKKTWVSTRLENKEILRCLDDTEWNDCDEEYIELLEKLKSERKENLEANPWGYYGKYNPETSTFCIVNIVQQKIEEDKKKKAKLHELQSEVKKGNITQQQADEEMEIFNKDFRTIYSGRNCREGWGIPKLLEIVLRTLKLKAPKTFRVNDSIILLKKLVLKEKKIMANYTPEEIDDASKDDLRRMIYWGKKQPDGPNSQIDRLCIAIENFFKNTQHEGSDLLIPDNQCGVQGGHIKKPKAVRKQKEFRTEVYIPSEQKEGFLGYLQQISKLINGCHKIKKFKPDIDNKQWILIFNKKKLVGCITYDKKENVITNVCTDENYRKTGASPQVIKKGLQHICKKSPNLLIDKHSKTYNKTLKLYTKNYGFSIKSDDGRTTTLQFECK